ncbi:unnamed protein product [Alopecurus aequalis]
MAGRHLCSPAPLFEDDDLLAEILVRLPALPPSLPGAMLVCTRWRSLVSDPGFRRRFLQRNPVPLQYYKASHLLYDSIIRCLWKYVMI